MTSSGSRSASGRVNALSSAQAAVAPATASAPNSPQLAPDIASTVSATPPAAIAVTAIATRAPIGSRYKARARSTVKTASRLSSKAPAVAPARWRPQASKVGAIAAPAIATASNRPASLRRIGACERRERTRNPSAEAAAPAYSSAAVVRGPRSRPAHATTGVVRPKATAASAARMTPVTMGERPATVAA